MKKTQEELIEIYNETETHFNQYKKPFTVKQSSLYTKPLDRLFNVRVDNIDCIDMADIYSQLGKTCMLNMASFKRPGGGVRNGRMSQEEEIARRSNLMDGLSPSFYPLGVDEYIYSSDVTFFKNGKYELTNREFQADVISVAALDLKEYDMHTPMDFEQYRVTTQAKIRTILTEPAKHGVHYLVLSAFGCGVFKNDPKLMAWFFREALQSGLANHYTQITFAILNDQNSVGDNYTAFKNRLDNHE